MAEVQIHTIFMYAGKRGASDIHFKAGEPPILRVNGKIERLETQAIDGKAMAGIAKALLSEGHQIALQETGNADSAVEQEIEGVKCRYRVNAAREKNGLFIAVRLVPERIMPVHEIGFPFHLWEDLISLQRGLVLVTGVTGSGKTTTLASLIQRINDTYADHIITIEDPIEFVYPKSKSIISQREIGINVKSFSDGVKYVLRQDPDVILIGEIRDRETATKALEAAATGHLVFSTLHTKDAADTVRRYVNIFEAEDQNNVRNSLASNLAYVLCQQLLPHRSGYGRALAMEVMNVQVSPAIQNHLRKAEYYRIISEIQIGKANKMITMDQRLKELFYDGRITRETAIGYSHYPDEMRHELG